MGVVGPFIEHNDDGLACRMSYSVFRNDPDFSCRWLCPFCLIDTKFRAGKGGGICAGAGGCGRTFRRPIRDRSPFCVEL